MPVIIRILFKIKTNAYVKNKIHGEPTNIQ